MFVNKLYVNISDRWGVKGAETRENGDVNRVPGMGRGCGSLLEKWGFWGKNCHIPTFGDLQRVVKEKCE